MGIIVTAPAGTDKIHNHIILNTILMQRLICRRFYNNILYNKIFHNNILIILFIILHSHMFIKIGLNLGRP